MPEYLDRMVASQMTDTRLTFVPENRNGCRTCDQTDVGC
jgi:hypothetical protein